MASNQEIQTVGQRLTNWKNGPTNFSLVRVRIGSAYRILSSIRVRLFGVCAMEISLFVIIFVARGLQTIVYTSTGQITRIARKIYAVNVRGSRRKHWAIIVQILR